MYQGIYPHRSKAEPVAVEPELAHTDVIPTKELIMSTPATLSPAQVFQEIGQLLLNNVFANALPVITAAISQVEANPAELTNPLTVGLFANKLMVDLLATLPSIENASVVSVGQFVEAFLTTIQAKVSAPGVSAAQAGAALAAAV